MNHEKGCLYLFFYYLSNHFRMKIGTHEKFVSEKDVALQKSGQKYFFLI